MELNIEAQVQEIAEKAVKEALARGISELAQSFGNALGGLTQSVGLATNGVTAKSWTITTTQAIPKAQAGKRRGRPPGAKNKKVKTEKVASAGESCALIGCKKPRRSKGYCSAHYQKYNNLRKASRLPEDWKADAEPGTVKDIVLPRGRAASKALKAVKTPKVAKAAKTVKVVEDIVKLKPTKAEKAALKKLRPKFKDALVAAAKAKAEQLEMPA